MDVAKVTEEGTVLSIIQKQKAMKQVTKNFLYEKVDSI